MTRFCRQNPQSIQGGFLIMEIVGRQAGYFPWIYDVKVSKSASKDAKVICLFHLLIKSLVIGMLFLVNWISFCTSWLNFQMFLR